MSLHLSHGVNHGRVEITLEHTFGGCNDLGEKPCTTCLGNLFVLRTLRATFSDDTLKNLVKALTGEIDLTMKLIDPTKPSDIISLSANAKFIIVSALCAALYKCFKKCRNEKLPEYYNDLQHLCTDVGACSICYTCNKKCTDDRNM